MTGTPPEARQPVRVAYIAAGKLYVVDPDGSRREITSDFAQGLIDRSETSRQRNEWKRGSMGWNATSAPPELVSLGLINQSPQGQRQVNMITTVPLDCDRLLYALQTDTIGGLFEYTLSRDEERRLAHRTEFRIGELDAHRADERLITSLAYPDGTAQLATMRPGGGRLTEITEGDSVDQAPSWAGDADNAIVYQSAGIARGQHGDIIGLSTFRIERLDLDRGEHAVLAESDEHDLLLPRVHSDGSLYFIRRPYQELIPRRPLWQMVRDALLFPVMVAVAVFWFLNAFSMLFAKRPLTSAGGPRTEDQRNTRQLVLYGRLIEAQKEAKARGKRKGLAVVPNSWELVRRDSDGAESVLATGVGHYDLGSDGSLVYTNGVHVWLMTSGAGPVEIVNDSFIERVSLIV